MDELSLTDLAEDWPDAIICLSIGPCKEVPEVDERGKVYVNTCACYRWATQMEI